MTPCEKYFCTNGYRQSSIGGVPLVKHVHDRHHFHRAAVTVFRVHVVLYHYEPYPERREYIIHVLSHLDVISAKPRKIFYDDGIYNARLCVVQQPLHFGTLKGRARNAVVDIFAVNLEAVFLGIFTEHRPLIVDRYRFALTFVLLRKPQIQS